MPTKRAILDQLTATELRTNVDRYDRYVDDRRVKSQLVAALARCPEGQARRAAAGTLPESPEGVVPGVQPRRFRPEEGGPRRASPRASPGDEN